MGLAAGGVFAGMAQQMFNPMQPVAPVQPPAPSGRFTQRAADVGTTTSPPPPPPPPQGDVNDLATRLRNLETLLSQGLITQAEYDTRRADIINQI